MKRKTALFKAIANLSLSHVAAVCGKCSGRGKWTFFETTGVCPSCRGTGLIGGNKEIHSQINNYIDSGGLDLDEVLKHSNKVS